MMRSLDSRGGAREAMVEVKERSWVRTADMRSLKDDSTDAE